MGKRIKQSNVYKIKESCFNKSRWRLCTWQATCCSHLHFLLCPAVGWLCFLTGLNYVETLTYDHQSLLDIHSRCMVVSETNLGKFMDIPHRSILWDIPDFLRRWPLDIIPRKRRRRHGKRGGVIIRLKSYLRAGAVLCLGPQIIGVLWFGIYRSSCRAGFVTLCRSLRPFRILQIILPWIYILGLAFGLTQWE